MSISYKSPPRHGASELFNMMYAHFCILFVNSTDGYENERDKISENYFEFIDNEIV